MSGNKYLGLGVDLWSCGIILFVLVCGYLPFEDTNTGNLYKKILKGEYVIPNFVGNEVKDMIKRLLTIEPTKRISISEIKNHRFYNLVRFNEEEYFEEKVERFYNFNFLFFYQ